MLLPPQKPSLPPWNIMEHHAGRVEVAWVVKMYRKLFFFQIFIAHEIINFQLLLTYKILKVFFLLLLGVCRYPSRRPHPLPCTYRQIYTHTHTAIGENCAAACTEGINTRFAKKLRRTKKKVLLHVRSKKHLGLKRIIWHHSSYAGREKGAPNELDFL